MKRPFNPIKAISKPHSTHLVRFVIAAMIYIFFATYLYRPYFKNFSTIQYLYPINLCIAALGSYLLSQRWLIGFSSSFFAGAIYGFGPFMCSLVRFHPSVGFLTAIIPWLFWPAAYISKTRIRWLSIPLTILPFLTIVLFFWITTKFHLFTISTQIRLHLIDLTSLFIPIILAEQSSILIGFYHIPVAALVTGLAILIVGRRFGIMAITALSIILAYGCFTPTVSPAIWLCIPMLVGSISIGMGIQAFIYAGYADRLWILLTDMILGGLTIVALLLATKYFQAFLGLGTDYAKLFVQSAKMYALGTSALVILFFITSLKLRARWLRWIIICGPIGIDVFFSTRSLIDKIL